MILGIHFDEVGKISLKRKELSEIIILIAGKEGYTTGKINIIITTDKRLRIINKAFLDRDDYTDIIAFSDFKKEKVSGELYISLERILSNSGKFSEKNFEKELYRVIIHGILHLVGYNDLTFEERKQMTQLEDYYLNELNLHSEM